VGLVLLVFLDNLLGFVYFWELLAKILWAMFYVDY